MNFVDVICNYATITNVKQMNLEDIMCNYTTTPNANPSNRNIKFSTKSSSLIFANLVAI